MFEQRKYWLLLILTAIIFLTMEWFFLDFLGKGTGESWIEREIQYKIQFMGFVGLSLILNFYILFYHWTTPPHPKYIMLPKRKISIAAHVLGGSSEVIVGALAWYCLYSGQTILLDGASWAIIMAACVVIAHGPSSLFQTPGVFGAKGIMVPGYISISTLHIYCAIHVVLDPNSLLWVERTWITLQAYAFVRIFGRTLWVNKAIPDSTYTVGTMAGGATIVHFVIGPAGFLIVCIGIWAHIMLYKIIMKPTANEYRAFMEERTHSATIDNDARALWLQSNTDDDSSKLNEIDAAKAAFNSLDYDNSGTLDVVEIESLLTSWHATPHVMQAFLDRCEGTDGIDFETFQKTVWALGNIETRLMAIKKSGNENDDDDTKAKKIFNFLDIDNSGFIELMEMELLLVEWGMTSYEAVAYMKRFGGDDGKISLNEFREQMAPLWKFAYKRAFRDADAAQPLH
jgi:Ca2+-binding EF-hand superfamily protein